MNDASGCRCQCASGYGGNMCQTVSKYFIFYSIFIYPEKVVGLKSPVYKVIPSLQGVLGFQYTSSMKSNETNT